jgi:hypothetical protein
LINIGDPYTDAGKLKMRAAKKDGYKEAGHDLPFKPTKDVMRRVRSDFEHHTDLNEAKKSYKDAEGRVIIEPRNFLTNPIKKGQTGKQ